jgi:hypothetical protein
MAVQSPSGIFLRCPYADDLAQGKPLSRARRGCRFPEQTTLKEMRSSPRVRGQPPPWRKKFREVDGEGNSVELNFPKEMQ